MIGNLSRLGSRIQNNGALARHFRDTLINGLEWRRKWQDRAVRSGYYDRGIFYYKVNNKAAGRLLLDERMANRGVLRVPLIRRLLNLAASTATSDDIGWQAVASGVDEDSVLSARAATFAMRDFVIRENPARAQFKSFRDALVTGHAFKRVWCENDYVTIVLPPDTLELYEAMSGRELRNWDRMPSGDIRAEAMLPVVRESDVSPFSVIVPPGTKEFDHAETIICTELKPLSWVVNNIPEHAREVPTTQSTSESTYNNIIGGMGGRSFYTDQEYSPMGNKMVRVYEIWMREGREWVLFWGVGEGMRFLYEADETADFHPLVSMTVNPQGDLFWCDGMVEDVVDLQRDVCIAKTDLSISFHNSVKDIIFVPQDMKTPFSNDYSQIVPINPRSQIAPFRLPMPTDVHHHLMSHLNDSIQKMYEAFGMSDISRGNLPSRATTGGLALARETDTAPIMRTHNAFLEMERKKMLKALKFMASLYDEPRWVAISGQQGEIYAEAVRGKQFANISDVNPQPMGRLRGTVEERLERSVPLIQAGLFEDGAEGRLERLRDFVHVQKDSVPEPSQDQIQRARAVRENSWIKNGRAGIYQEQAELTNPLEVGVRGEDPQGIEGPVIDEKGMPLLGDYDIDEVHVEEHIRALSSLDRSLDSYMILVTHIQEHSQRITMAKQESDRQHFEDLAKESLARYGGQLAAAGINESNSPQGLTPHEGGRRSGIARRGE